MEHRTKSAIRLGLLVIAWLGVVGAAAGFFLPWALLDVKYKGVTGSLNQVTQGTPLAGLTKRLTKEVGRVTLKVKRGAGVVTGELPDLSKIPTQVSGFEIPQFANRADAKVVLALAEVLTGQQQLGAKSYVVYLLPGLALIGVVFATLLKRVRVVCALLGLVCVAVAGAGFYKLLTVKTDTLLVAITFGRGLWLSLWSYVGIGLAAIGLAMLPSPPRAASRP